MKIGIEAQRIFSPKKHGMDIYALELIKALQEIDHQNEYVVFVKSDKDICLKSSSNLKIVEVKGATYLDWEQVYLPKAIKDEKIDVMHFTSNTASVQVKCPFLLTLHDIVYLEDSLTTDSLQQLARHFYSRWNVPKVVSQAKYVLTVSSYERVQIHESLSVEYDRLKTIYKANNKHFKLIEDFSELQKMQLMYNLPAHFIFFLGSEAPQKNMNRVLAAYAQYLETEPNALPLVIAESTEEEVKASLKKINKSNIYTKITLTGYIPHDDLPAVYNLATLFLYPSLRESFGTPIIEAMACGTPVITSQTSAMPETADQSAMLINPTNIDEITEAIKKILSNKKLYNYLRYNGLCRSMDFSWENTAHKMLRLYYRSAA